MQDWWCLMRSACRGVETTHAPPKNHHDKISKSFKSMSERPSHAARHGYRDGSSTNDPTHGSCAGVDYARCTSPAVVPCSVCQHTGDTSKATVTPVLCMPASTPYVLMPASLLAWLQVVDLVMCSTFADLTDDDVTSDPLVLLPCKHVFVTSTLDGHLEMSTAYSSSSGSSVLPAWQQPLYREDFSRPKGCPSCRTLVSGVRRYGRVMLHNLLGLTQRRHAQHIR